MCDMKKLLFICLISICFFICFCSENNVSENISEAGLCFYFLNDTTLTASQLFNADINQLKLAEKPFLTYNDMHYYNWADHVFQVDSLKAKDIFRRSINKPSVFGIPFIVKVDNERIYLGAFWFLYSSIPPRCPYIEAPINLINSPNIIQIQKSWKANETDVRNDIRIYTSLKKHGLLKE